MPFFPDTLALGYVTGSSQGRLAINVRPLRPDNSDEVWPVSFPYAQRGAFGLSIAQEERPVTNLTFHYGINSFFVMTSSFATGLVSASNSKAQLCTGTSSLGAATLESRSGILYTPGQGIVSRFTAVFATGTQGSFQEIGLGDDLDGLFFALSGSSFGVVRRQNGVDYFVSQSAWNGFDRFDGTGPSGVILNTNFGNVYAVKFQWLGFGPLRFFIEDPLSQEQILVHTIRYGNTSQDPSIFNPTLPLRAHIRNAGNTSSLLLQTPSMGAFHEGPESLTFAPGATGSFRAAAALTGTLIFSMRNRDIFFGRQNRVRVQLTHMSVANLGGGVDVNFQAILNPTLVTSSYKSFDPLTSVMETNDLVSSVSSGRVVFQTRVNNASSDRVDLSAYGLILNPTDVVAIVATAGTGGTPPVTADVVWRELFSG